ncbi:MAG: capsular polysaccharide synthesis protein [Acidovorax sp.]
MTTSDLTFKNRGELWLAQWMRRFYMLCPRTLEKHVDAPFSVYTFGTAPARTAPIPAIIWAYWNGAVPPLVVQRCFDNWHRFNPRFDIRILDDTTVRAYIAHIPPVLDAVSAAKRADWIRLELLRRYGGIWLDSSTILTASLDWVLAQQTQAQSDFIGYYLERYTSDPACPVVENWFMAAPPGSAFIADLQDEFTTQVIARSGTDYIAHLEALGVYLAVRQKIDIPHYLSMHLALQFILQTKGGYRLCLGKAEDGPFYYHALGQWGRTPLKIRLMFSRIAGPLPPLMKLRAPDRRRLDDYLERKLYVPGSVAADYLSPGRAPARP